MGVVETYVSEHVAVVALNRPEARNALDPELIVALADTWDRLAGDDAVRVVVITAATGSTFCAGFDLAETIPLITGAAEPSTPAGEAIVADQGLLGRATLRDVDLGKPVIAAVSGHAIAGGMELMLAADLRIVARGVKLGLSEVALGLIPAMGGTARLGRHLPLAVAQELLLTGKPLTSDQLAPYGLINRLEPADNVRPVAMELAATIAANAPLAVRAARRVLRASADLSEADALAMEAAESDALGQTADAREGPRAFVEKRPPVFQGR